MEPRILRILLVDDDTNLLATMSDILKLKGFEPIPVETGAAALAQIELQSFDVALIDLQLEDMPGLKALRGIKTLSPGTECIMLTGHASQGSAIDAVNAGAYSYFLKPCDMDQLVLSIRQAGEKQAALQAHHASEERFRALIQNAADLIVVIDAEGVIRYVSPSSERILGYLPEEAIGRNFLDWVHPDDVPIAKRSLASRGKTPGTSQSIIEVRSLHKNGTWRMIEVLGTNLLAEPAVRGIVMNMRDVTERKQAEDSIRISEKSYRDLFENSIVGISQALPDGRLLRVNSAYAHMYGYSNPEEMLAEVTNIGQQLYAHPEERDELLQILTSKGKSEPKEFLVVRRDGTRFYVLVAARQIKDASDNLLCYEATHIDITERKRAEEARQESEERFRVIFEKANDAIHIENGDDEILAVNSRMCELMGYSREELLKMHVADLQAPEERQAGSVIKKELARHGSALFERLNLHRDGHRIPVEISIARIELPSGDLYASIVRDISERKRAEEALSLAEKKYRTLVEQSPAIIYIVEPGREARISYISPQIEQVLGFTPEEWIKQPGLWESLLHPEDRERVLADNDQSDLSGQPFKSEYRIHAKDGRVVWLLDESIQIRDQDGKLLYIQGIETDITERKRAEAELQASHEAERILAERLAVLSEITTDLSKAESLDALCRSAVEFGRERLDFDRLSIWFLAEDNLTMVGTFGVDTEGRITDERKERFPIGSDYPNTAVFQGQTPLLRLDDTSLALKGQVVGQGQHVTAGLWDGKAVIGFISVDNLLRQRPFSDRDCEIIRLYASALGHLISLKRTEEEVVASEERYRMLAENMTDTVWLMDLNLKTTYISPSVIRLRGYTLDEINTVPLDQQMTSESLARVVEIYTNDLATERLAQADLPISTTLELEMYKKDGTAFWSENTFSLIRDPLGQPLAILGSAREITGRKKVQEALESSEKRFRALIENNTDAIVLVDPRGLILYESPAYARMMGRDLQQRLGMSSFEHIHPEDRQSVAVILNELIQYPGKIGQTTFRNQHKNGSWRWIEATATNLLGESAVQAIVINMHDITERKQAEEAIVKTEYIYRQAITQAGGVPYQIEYANGNYVFLGEGIESLAGYFPAEMTGALFTSRVRQTEAYGKYKDLPRPEREQLTLQGKIKEWREDDLFERKDGSLIWLADHSVPVYNSNGKNIGALGILMDITEQKKAEQNVRQRVAELEVLYESSLSINRSLEPKEIAQKMIEILAQKLAWHHAVIRLYHPETDSIEVLAFNDPGLSKTEAERQMDRLNQVVTRPGKGLSGWVIKHGKAVRSSQVKKDRRYVETYPGIQSGLYVPIQIGGRTIGSIAVESEAENAFSMEDERMLTTLAAQSAIAFENARLFAETEKRLHKLSALHTIDTAISASVDIHVTLNILIEHVVSELAVDAAAVLVFDPIARTLEYNTSRGFHVHLVDGMHIQLGAGLAGQAALRGQMQSVSDLRDAPPSQGGPKPIFDVYEGEGFVAHYAKPLIAKGQIQGVLEVYWRSPFQPDEEWLTFFEMLSGQAAIAIDNVALFDNLQRSNEDILLAYDATIQGWSQALELRDKETEGHAQRVTELTLRLAQRLGIPDAELEHVRRGTLLHDIGKMGIPDAILLKPGKLTEEEWVIMRQHPVFAFELLSAIAYLKPALDIPHYHHEKWDGSGYPDGLKGDQIPLYARIFAIVDVYDALTNERPYRPAWTVEKSLAHIREQSGTHFDPRIVEAFLALITAEN